METLVIPVELFYSYADADAQLLKRLESHLSTLRQQRVISTWHAHHILPGSHRQQEIEQHLSAASLILLLLSADFLASDYTYGGALQRIIERKQARIIPILMRPCDWKGTLFKTLQMLPRNKKAVTTWRNREAAFAEIAEEIRLALSSLPPLPMRSTPAALPKIYQIPYKRNPVLTGSPLFQSGPV